MTNFSSSHEARSSKFGDERLAFPPNHIEIDNRLSWFLGRLEKEYGDDAVYVHLIRDPLKVAESYNRRWNYYGSIAMAYTLGILKSNKFGISSCIDYVRTVTENIEAFLVSKSRVFVIDIQNPKDQFKLFWQEIGAEGELNQALAEFDHTYDTSIPNEGVGSAVEFDTESDRIIYEMQGTLRLVEAEKRIIEIEKCELKEKQARRDISLEKVKKQLSISRKRVDFIEGSLSYLVGFAVVDNFKSPVGWIKLPFAVIRAGLRYAKMRSTNVVWKAVQCIPHQGYEGALKFLNDNGNEREK